MTRILRTALLSLAATLGLAIPAQAGSFEVLACDAAAGNANHSWTFQATLPSAVLQGPTTCPSTGDYSGLLAQTALSSNGDPTIPTTGAYAHWAFTAPAGLTITQLRLQRMLGMEGGSGWRLYGRTADGATLLGETCTVVSGTDECNVGGVGSPEITRAVNTTSLAYGFTCDPGGAGATQCARGYTIHAARAAIYSARITLSDPTAPTITAPAGSLVTETGYHQGTETVTFGGADATGLKTLAVYVDGAIGASEARACDYSHTLPCNYPGRPADPATGTLGVDTTTLSDGAHVVQPAVVDAAGNETRAAARSIVVDNHGPDLDSITAGARADSSPALSASFAPLAGQVAPVTEARWALCPAAATTGCTTGTVAADNTGGRLENVAIPAEGDWDLRLQLVDAAGNVGPAGAMRARHAIPAPPPAPTPAPVAGPQPTPTATPVATPVRSVVPTPPPGPVLERPVARRAAGLKLLSARLTGTRLTVRGALTRTATGPVTVRYHARVGGRTRRVQRIVRVRAGRFALALTLARSLRGAARGTVELRYAGDRTHTPRTLRETVKL